MSSSIEPIQSDVIVHDNDNQHHKLEYALNHTPCLIACCDTNLRYRFVNKPYAEFFGHSPVEMAGKRIEYFFEEARFQASLPHMQKALAGENVCFQTSISYEVENPGRYEVRYIPEFTDDQVTGFYAFVTNIDDTLNVKEAHELLRYAVDQGMEGLSIHDSEGVFVYVNPAEAAMYGYEVEEILGQTYRLFYDDEELEKIENEYFPILMETGKWHGTLNARRKNGSHFYAHVSLTILKNRDNAFDGLICTCRDVTEKKQADDKLSYLAHYDHLTGLTNRLLFKDRLGRLITQARRHENQVAVLFLDLDDFKHINDTLGHTAGDQLIIKVANRLSKLVREEDLVARFGGDEFAIAIGGLTASDDVIKLATKIIQSLDEPITIVKQQIVQKTSIGISLYPTDGLDIDTLIKNADTAMYGAKEDKLHSYRFYANDMSKRAAQFLQLSSELRQAIDNHEFKLHYQPIISLSDRKIDGFEALVRWQHPEKDLVYPDSFIPYAEKSGLIKSIDLQVLNQACLQASRWLKEGYDFDQISVNFSGFELQNGFEKTVDAILQEHQLPPKYLKLELTETFLMSRLQQPVNILGKLRELGINIAIDDFGVGYSSLTRLKHLPVTCLKIDRSFIREIHNDHTDLNIVDSIGVLGRSLGLSIIAEGVETIEQLNILESLNTGYAQGYYISRPAPAENIDQLYKNIEGLQAEISASQTDSPSVHSKY